MRRSRRMALHPAIDVSGEVSPESRFYNNRQGQELESLNRYGAAVQLNRELQAGSVVKKKNQRGIQFSRRIVAQLRALKGVSA